MEDRNGIRYIHRSHHPRSTCRPHLQSADAHIEEILGHCRVLLANPSIRLLGPASVFCQPPPPLV